MHVEPHEVFERRDDDVYIDAEIPITMAVLGGKIEVPTVHGDVTLKIPKGTQPNEIFRFPEARTMRLCARASSANYR